jgi:hypothetical protein
MLLGAANLTIKARAGGHCPCHSYEVWAHSSHHKGNTRKIDSAHLNTLLVWKFRTPFKAGVTPPLHVKCNVSEAHSQSENVPLCACCANGHHAPTLPNVPQPQAQPRYHTHPITFKHSKHALMRVYRHTQCHLRCFHGSAFEEISLSVQKILREEWRLIFANIRNSPKHRGLVQSRCGHYRLGRVY